jgi:uncharacterized protein GlcG (DUF336 family)
MVRRIPLLLAAAAVSSAGYAQVPQYGNNITLEQAKKCVAAADAEATKRGWPMALAVVDTAGQLVYFQRAAGTQTGSTQVSQDKARTAAMFRRSTKVVQDVIAAGGAGLRFLTIQGAVWVEGGVPITIDGKIIGALGVSGMASNEDGEIAKFCTDVIK